jgi:hypothetical protein
MAQQGESDHRSHNQPSHEAQVKGGQHSHQGSQSEGSQKQVSQGTASESEDKRSQNQPSHEAQVKGGQHSHSGSGNR